MSKSKKFQELLDKKKKLESTSFKSEIPVDVALTDAAKYLTAQQYKDILKGLQDIYAKVGKIGIEDVTNLLKKYGAPSTPSALDIERRALHGAAIANEAGVPYKHTKDIDPAELINTIYPEYKALTGNPIQFNTITEIANDLYRHELSRGVPPNIAADTVRQELTSILGYSANKSKSLTPLGEIQIKSPTIETSAIRNPYESNIKLNKKLMDDLEYDQLERASVGMHEGEHARSDIIQSNMLQLPVYHGEGILQRPERLQVIKSFLSDTAQQDLLDLYNNIYKTNIKTFNDLDPKQLRELLWTNQPALNIFKKELSINPNMQSAFVNAFHHPTFPIGFENQQLFNYAAGVPNIFTPEQHAETLKTAGNLAQEYFNRSQLKKSAAAIPLAIGTASMLSPEEAEAAGIDTIIKRLGVTKEIAQEIKAFAKTKPAQDVFEEKIRAIQEVSGFKKGKPGYSQIGRGADQSVFSTPSGKALKVPIYDVTGVPRDEEILSQLNPFLVEQLGKGPKTTAVQTSEKLYQVQDLLKTKDAIKNNIQSDTMIKDLIAARDNLYDQFSKRSDASQSFVHPLDTATPDELAKLKQIEKLTEDRYRELYKQHGIDIDAMVQQYRSLPQEERDFLRNTSSFIMDESSIYENPVDAIGGFLELDIVKANKGIKPYDVHGANVGITKEGAPVILDTSRFGLPDLPELTGQQKEYALQKIAASPARKSEMKEVLYNKPDTFIPELPKGNVKVSGLAPTKKVAAMAPLTGIDTTKEFLTKPAKELANIYQENIQKPVSMAAQAIAEPIAKATALSPYLGKYATPELKETEQFQQDVLAAGLEMVLDPLNYVAPVASIPMALAPFLAEEPVPENPDLSKVSVYPRYNKLNKTLEKP